MIIDKHCTYSLKRPTREQCESFIWNTGSHIMIAALANGLALYFMEYEDLLPGILVGASAGLSQNLTHKTAHVLSKNRKETCHLPFGLEMVIAVGLTYRIAKELFHIFKYDFSRIECLKLQSIGMLSITLYNYSQNQGNTYS